MKPFFQKRLARHQQKMMKFLKYVLNDHFVLVCIFLIGGLGYVYSDKVKGLAPQTWWVKPLVAIIWLASLFVGQLATLAQEADKVFLLPKEKKLWPYLFAAVKHSFILPAVFLLLVCGVTMPLIVAVTHQPFAFFFFYVFILLCLKFAHLFLLVQSLYQNNDSSRRDLFWMWLFGSVFAIGMSLYGFIWVGILISVVMLWWQSVSARRVFAAKNLDWDRLVSKEQTRLRSIYRFFNLFTDVPEIGSKVKRRKYLDGILQRIAPEHQNTYLYLYARSFLRGSEYSGLFIRLLAVSFVIVLFAGDFWIALGVSLLILYLIGFQLLPIYNEYDYMLLTKLYPIANHEKVKAVGQLVSILLCIAGVLLFVAAVIALKDIKAIGVMFGAILVEVIFFLKIYLPRRLKKMERY